MCVWSLGFYSLFLGDFCSEPPHLSTSGPSGVDLERSLVVIRIQQVLSIPLWELSGLGPAPLPLCLQIEEDSGPFPA